MAQIGNLICAIRVYAAANNDLSPVLHTRLGIFLEKIADVDCEALQLLIERLS